MNDERFVASNGARIWTIQTGHVFPVMLCNGGAGCCDYLEPVAQMLDDVASVIRFEQRGCGRSEPVLPYNIETCLTDLEIFEKTTASSNGLSAGIHGAPIWR